MSTRYEYYEGPVDQATTIYGARYRGQSFTPQISHTIKTITVLVYKIGSPGWLTTNVYAVDGDGKPTGLSLATGTLNAISFTTNTAGHNEALDLGDGALLTSGIKYAIELRGTGTDNANCVGLRTDESAPTYSRGEYIVSNDSGSTWTVYTDRDMPFEEWGDPFAAPTVTADLSRGGFRGVPVWGLYPSRDLDRRLEQHRLWRQGKGERPAI